MPCWVYIELSEDGSVFPQNLGMNDFLGRCVCRNLKVPIYGRSKGLVTFRS
jgi:hypothetical protein